MPNAYLTTQQVGYLQHCGMLRGSPFSLNANKSKLTLKGQSNEILDPHFFHNSNQPGPLTNELKYFRF